MKQMSIFDGSTPFKITKPIRLIELFAGYGSQHLALKYLGVNVESYRICEWAVKSIQAYKDLHFGDDSTDYSADLTFEQIVDFLASKGISANYNDPMTLDQVKRMGEQKCRTVYNNIKATHNLVNIMQAKASDLNIVDTDKYCYIMTYSFPCQDLSKAGKGQGMAKDSGTRSGLLWEVERLLDECNGNLPQVLLMENVPDVVGSKNIKHFSAWLAKLESLGYKCYWKCLNAKNFGIPQNRNRCFMVSVLGDYDYDFPRELPLRLRLKHLLERQVDEKYYLSPQIIDYYIKHTQESIEKGNGFRFTPTDGNCIARAVTTRAGGRMDDNYIDGTPKCIQAGVLNGGKWDKMHKQSRRYYDRNGIAPTMHTCGGGKLEPKIAEPLTCAMRGRNPNNPSDRTAGTPTQQRLEIGGTNANCLTTVQKDSLVVEPIAYDEQNKYFRQDGCVETLTTDGSSPKHNNRVVEPNCRIRKLTPRETWRLMGVKDEDFERVQGNQSNSSLYHLSGDSIVTTVLMAIFGMMLQNDFDYEQLSLQG